MKTEDTAMDTTGSHNVVKQFHTSLVQYTLDPAALKPDSVSVSTSKPSVLRRSSRVPIPRRVYSSEPLPKLLVVPKTEVQTKPELKRARKAQSATATKLTLEDKTTHSPAKKQKAGYASPDVYAHLKNLSDHLVENADVMFCGINPGEMSAEIGHHYGNPSNHFWYCLHHSGFTPTRLPPTADHTLPKEFNLALTNLIERPSSSESELSEAEKRAAVPSLLAKIVRYRPRVICIVGLGISKTIIKEFCKSAQISYPPKKTTRTPKDPNRFGPGFQPYKMIHSDILPEDVVSVRETLFFAMPSTSGLVTQFQRNDKMKLFTKLKHMVDKLKKSDCDTTHMTPIQYAASVIPEPSSSSQ